MRILDLTSDPYFLPIDHPDVIVTCLPVGPSISPWTELKTIPRGKLSAVILHFLKARFGQYDWVVLPPVHVSSVVANGMAQRMVKAFIRRLSSFPFLCWLSQRLLFGKACNYCICDASDLESTSREFSQLTGARVYFKRNLKESPAHDSLMEWHPLPMPVPDRWLDAADPNPDLKTSDYFSAGDYNSERRKLLLEAGRDLAKNGWNVDLLEERVNPEQFWERMGKAKLCAAAQGCGYHSWRMFEASGLGCIPIVNQPPANLWSWFEDGKNCLVMEKGSMETVKKIEALLRDPKRVRQISLEARAAVDKWHRQSAIATRMVGILKRI